MITLSFLLWCLIGVYASILLWVALQYNLHLRRSKAVSNSTKQDTAGVCLSVVIAMRNESANIEKLLESLLQQVLPHKQWEACLIDDHSEDDTYQKAAAWLAQHPQLPIRLLRLPAEKAGKKAAISHGIEHSVYEFIVCTDADCWFGTHWLSRIASCRSYTQATFIGAPVRLYPCLSWHEYLQDLEMTALTAIGGMCLQWQIPGMCNGANMAFEKKAFLAVNGYEGNEHIASGDDEFLLQKIARLPHARLHFLPDEDAVVYTQAQHRLVEWIMQRKRWISKWKHHHSGFHKSLAVLIASLYLALGGAVVSSIVGSYPSHVLFMQLGLKFIVEYLFLQKVRRPHKYPLRMIHVLMLFVAYPIYSLYFAWQGIRSKNIYRWKNRTLHG